MWKEEVQGYIEAKTGQPLPSKYSRCNREHTCGYWRTPYEDGYGRLSPDEWKEKRIEQTKQRDYIVPKPQRTETTPSYMDMGMVEKNLRYYDHNNFVMWLRNKVGDTPVLCRHIQALARRYNLSAN
jgi:hypothetical protein